jgi:RNA polymerase sigma factor (sigma-70 family)
VGVHVVGSREEHFGQFMEGSEPRLRRALVAAYGWERGRDATAEAYGYAWEHWDRICAMENPVGYLYRVGQSRTQNRSHPVVFERMTEDEKWFEPALGKALAGLSERQRTAVVLVYGFGWTMREVGDVTGIAVTSIQNHLERGMEKLRRSLEVHSDA